MKNIQNKAILGFILSLITCFTFYKIKLYLKDDNFNFVSLEYWQMMIGMILLVGLPTLIIIDLESVIKNYKIKKINEKETVYLFTSTLLPFFICFLYIIISTNFLSFTYNTTKTITNEIKDSSINTINNAVTPYKDKLEQNVLVSINEKLENKADRIELTQQSNNVYIGLCYFKDGTSNKIQVTADSDSFMWQILPF